MILSGMIYAVAGQRLSACCCGLYMPWFFIASFLSEWIFYDVGTDDASLWFW